ncbi:hypothetical protein SDC9_177393 [bioreactor metagenome]|uniref:Uncharacterized protein n=1 Tax=bioreactor metagenome TaxID=1076179 RepID=A0A645GUK1_9ZZZZ
MGQLGLGDGLPVFGNFAVAAGLALSQLSLNNLQLLPQEIIPLTAGQVVTHLALHILLQL